MADSYSPGHLDTAITRFREFFTELGSTFIERDHVLTQFALALLCRQHVLMTGPPGTGKSQMASLTLGRIIDESTGTPSLFARQFTENTVQTDLIGPINFKTLMESGRTEHFTDEGILGSVHAFLDEVFDGRDMLLRSTLNILHEREVKQGGQIATGRIECAFMTSNRYIAEVLDTSRETLLAFIDRISFISFIPRGFANPESLRTVVRQHGGGFGRHTPTSFLTVQDVDVLQAATDLTYVPEEVCDAVAQLVERLDAELAEAQRYDPKFQPTRYLSTRTTVHATRVLRAAVMLDKITKHPKRALQVQVSDLKWLRFSLLLGGMHREAIAARIEHETDPRERRQLDIMATEAEVFERCLEKLPKTTVPKSPKVLDLGKLETLASSARTSGDPRALTDAVAALLRAAESGAKDADDAAALLIDTLGSLSGQALRSGLTPQLGQVDALAYLRGQLTELGGTLERTPGFGRPLAAWLRGRLLELLDAALRFDTAPSEATVGLLCGAPSAAQLAAQIDARFDHAQALLALRSQLREAARSPDDPAAAAALQRLEEELVLLWDAQFRIAAQGLLARSDAPLAEVLRSLGPVLERLGSDAGRLTRLGRDGELVRRVTGPRLQPLVARAFERLDGTDRPALVGQVESVVSELTGAAIADAIAPEQFVAWSVPALVRGEAEIETPTVTDRAAYDKARKQEHSISITDTLVRIAIGAIPPKERKADEPRRGAEAVWETLRTLDDGTKRKVVALDLARVRRGIEYLESWWEALQNPVVEEGVSQPVAVLEGVAASGYLRAVQGGAELLRLRTELDHLREVFPTAAEGEAALRERIEALDARSTKTMIELLQRRSDAAWTETLSE